MCIRDRGYTDEALEILKTKRKGSYNCLLYTSNYPTDEEFTAFKDWLVEESIVTPDPDTTDTLADATKLFGFCTCDGADNTWRYITFADVAEFVPISYVGSDTYQGDTAVEDGAADEIAADAQERAEN